MKSIDSVKSEYDGGTGEVDIDRPDPRAMTVGELASLLGVKTRQARKLATRRRWIYGIETSKAGARYLILREAAEDYAAHKRALEEISK